MNMPLAQDDKLPPLDHYTPEIGETTDLAALAEAQQYDPLALKGFVGFWELADNNGVPDEGNLKSSTL